MQTLTFKVRFHVCWAWIRR